MKITRSGSAANHGTRAVNFPSPAIEWSPGTACLVVRQGGVRDFTSGSRHSYNLAITRVEIGAMLEALAKAALADPKTMEELLSTSLKSLTQLQFIGAGLHNAINNHK